MKANLYNFACWIIVIIVLAYVSGEDECPPGSPESIEKKLSRTLLCNYDTSNRPVKNAKNATWLTFGVILKYFTFDVTKSTLTLDAWMHLNWNDHHITWNPDEQNGIQSLQFESYQLWTPDLSVYNMANQGAYPNLVSGVRCRVSSKGIVVCLQPIHIEALCVPNLLKYPFDTQTCVISFGSWTHSGEELDIKVESNVVTMIDMEPNGEWEITKYTTTKQSGKYPCCPNETFPSVEVTLDLKRLSAGHSAGVIIPTIVVVILTFLAMALSPTDSHRLIIMYLNLAAQFFQVHYISSQVPLKGDQVPLLLLYARDSLLLAVIALVFTFIFRSIMQKKTIAPGWISNTISKLISCRVGQMIFLSDTTTRGVATAKGEEDGATIVNTEVTSNSQDWEIFGKIMDKLLLISYIIVYFVMTVAFIP